MIEARSMARDRLIRPSVPDAAPWVIASALLAVALRAPFWSQGAFPDEGGALLVVRHWRAGGPGLYGDLFFDRPPLLVLFWRFADLLGGVQPARLLATGGVVLLVLSAGWAGHQVGHRRGARWAGLVAAALASTPLLGTQEVNGELLAAPLVMLSCAMTLAAVRGVERPVVRSAGAFVAGVTGAAALLVKQNLVDGLLFAFVLVLAASLTRTWPRGAVSRVVVPGALGALLPLGATLLWAAAWGPGLHPLWYSLYGFRADAAAVIAAHSMTAPDIRLMTLGVICLLSGLVPLLAGYLWLARRRLREKDPFTVALLAMLVMDLLGAALGGSYWPHYLIEAAPAAALAAGSMPALLTGGDPWPRRAMVSVVASATVATVVAASPFFTSSRSGERALIGWLAHAHRRGDTAIVTYGHPNIIEVSGLMTSGYPYLWSLPVRTEDPRLALLRSTVSSRTGPTWIVEWISFDTWGIDPAGRLAAAVREHYRHVATVCGVPVFLRDGAERQLPANAPVC